MDPEPEVLNYCFCRQFEQTFVFDKSFKFIPNNAFTHTMTCTCNAGSANIQRKIIRDMRNYLN